MKKFLIMAGAALLLAGCNRENAGGTSDQYGTGSSGATSTNYNSAVAADSNAQGGATSPGGTNSATGSSTP
jgi:hypothetical protein